MMSRYTIYVGVSTLLANAVLFRAYYERPNFYSAAVYVSQSNGSLMLLVNLALICCLSFGYGLQRLLYGPLRPIETEQLYDKAWFAVSETLLAMTIFRDDIGFSFFVMFLCLLGGKVWQWIGEGRVEFLEQQPPANPRLFHSRLSVSLVLSVVFDITMMRHCIDTILREARPGMMVMFAFEYALLAIVSISTLLRYVLSLVEMLVVHRQTKAREESRRLATEEAQRQAQVASEGSIGTDATAQPATEEDDDDDDADVPGWEEKGRWVFYLDLTTDFIKSVVYCGFFTILIAFHGIPIHIMRDLFFTIRSFIKRIHDFMQYRNATKDMNARYPDATAEELANENTCIVCREDMRPWVEPGAEGARPGRRMDERQRPKKLPCGHVLHFGCLRSWLERQQVCPTCRRPVIAQATPPPAPQANQGNQGQQNPPNPPNDLQNFFNRIGGRPGNQPQGGQNGQQGGQVIRANNVRTWNLGPFRLVVGNVAVPPANNAQNAQNRAPNPQQQNAPLNNMVHQGQPINGMLGGHTGDVQTDILRIQENIINSIRQLHAQHGQLEQLQGLLAELHRIQQVTGGPANAQLPSVQPANANWGAAGAQRAYLPVQGQEAMGPGHADLPEGLVLPPGYTLRRMAPVQPLPEAQATFTSPQAPQRPPSDHIRRALYPEVYQNNGQQGSQGSRAPSPGVSGTPRTSIPPSTPANAEEPAASAQSGEAHSGWSFGNLDPSSTAGGQTESSSSSAATNAPRQATVEDSEGQNE